MNGAAANAEICGSESAIEIVNVVAAVDVAAVIVAIVVVGSQRMQFLQNDNL